MAIILIAVALILTAVVVGAPLVGLILGVVLMAEQQPPSRAAGVMSLTSGISLLAVLALIVFGFIYYNTTID